MIINLFNGFCMAIADSVPGVSGGTIAFILGFYEQLLESINSITSRNREKLKGSISFLIKLGIGWIIGMSSSVLFLSSMFEKHIYLMTSLFLGLTTASIIYIIKTELKFDIRKIIFTIIGIVIVVLISSFNGKIIPNGSLSLSNLSFFEGVYIFIAGMITISAMVLPGISGSTLLLIMGVYIPIISSIHRLMTMDFSVLLGLIIFGLGVIFGFITSVRIIRRAFKKNRLNMIYFIVGLTIGSLYSISNGPKSLSVNMSSINISNFNVGGFLIGVGILILLEIIRMYFIKNDNHK